MRSIHDSLTVNVLRIREYFMEYFRPILNKYGVTEQQWRIIRCLQEYQDIPIEKMSSIVCISSPSLTGILKRMETMGWVKRRLDSRDKRCNYISLTDKGQDLYTEISIYSEQAYVQLEMDIGKEEIQILSGILAVITNKCIDGKEKSTK